MHCIRYECMYARMCACICLCKCFCMSVCMYDLFICLWAFASMLCMFSVFVCLFDCLYICMHVCLRACVVMFCNFATLVLALLFLYIYFFYSLPCLRLSMCLESYLAMHVCLLGPSGAKKVLGPQRFLTKHNRMMSAWEMTHKAGNLTGC